MFLAICFRKLLYDNVESLVQWIMNRLCQLRNGSEREALQMENLKVESHALLNTPQSNNTDTRGHVERSITDTNERKTVGQHADHALRILHNDTEANPADLTAPNKGPQYYADGEFHKIRHDSFADDEEVNSEHAKAKDTDTKIGINPDDSLGHEANQIDKSKGIVRVITEIKLR